MQCSDNETSPLLLVLHTGQYEVEDCRWVVPHLISGAAVPCGLIFIRKAKKEGRIWAKCSKMCLLADTAELMQVCNAERYLHDNKSQS